MRESEAPGRWANETLFLRRVGTILRVSGNVSLRLRASRRFP